MTDSQTDSPAAKLYSSYLVRFWKSHEQGCWHASAQSVQTGNTVLFGDVESLLVFLQNEIRGGPGTAEGGLSTGW